MPNTPEKSEMLTVYDKNMNPIGARTRAEVHANELLHQTIRLWCISKEDKTIWFQQRSQDKALFPGRFDLAATGHIDPGETPDKAVLRELQEETGLQLKPDDLIKAGAIPYPFRRPDGKLDNEFANIYLYMPEKTPCFQTSDEVAGLAAMDTATYDMFMLDGEPVDITMYQPNSDKTKPPVKTGTKTVNWDDFCCMNPTEWNLIKQASMKAYQASQNKTKTRTTSDMPDINESKDSTPQPEL